MTPPISLPLENVEPTIDHSDSDSEDDFMPALPPDHDLTSRPKPKVLGPIGPTLPPGFHRPTAEEPQESESDDQDGPMPLPSHLIRADDGETEGVKALREREEREAERDRLERESKTLKREEWMLVPPKELDLPAC